MAAGCFWLSLTCDRELQQGTLKTFPLPAVRETAYRFILLTADGGAPYDDKLAFSEQGNNSELDLALEGITASFGNGILLFQEIDDHVSVLIENLPLTGTLRALVSSKLSSDLGLALAGKQSQHSVRRSTHSGWFEWRGLAAELLRHPDVRLYPSLARIECLRPVLTPANIVIRGGIRIGSSFVALLSSLPSFQIDDADHLDWIHPGEPARAMQKLGPEGTWRFGVNSAASELVGSHRIRAFYKDVMIAERTVSFIEGSFTTQYKSPQNEDRWLIEERSIDLKFLSEVVFPDSPVSRRLPDHSVGSPSPLHIEESEARHSDTLDEFIITLACIFEAQRGIAEGPLVQAFMSALGIYGAELWAVIRAWTEAGFLDVLSDARWRARVYFPRKPRLVYVHRGNKNWGVLTGLIPRFLLTRFRNVCSSLGLKLSARASFSSHVPSIYECEVETVDQVIHLSQELEIGHLGKSSLSDYQGATVRKLAEEYSTPIHDSWPSFRSWDWNRKMFLARADSAERAGVSLTWCRRDDGPDRFKVHRDGEQLWWTRSRTWAVLAAYTLAGEMPFERLEALTIEAWGDSVYLPLPVARAIALSARTLPGPVKTTERIVYRYEFANSRERERVLEALWPGSSPNSPSRPQEVDAAVTILLSQQGASSMPIPSELRYSLALLSGTSLISSSTLIAMSALPRLYALRRLLQERKCQWL